MNKQEIIAEARAIAKQLSFRSGIDGEVQPGIRRRWRTLALRAGLPFEAWRDHTECQGKPGQVLFNGKPRSCEVHDVTVHDDIGHAARSLQIRLSILDWQLLQTSEHPSSYGDWSASHAETKIIEAVKVINELCDWLEQHDPDLCEASCITTEFHPDETEDEDRERKQRGVDAWNREAGSWRAAATAMNGTNEPGKQEIDAAKMEVKRFAAVTKQELRIGKPGAKRSKRVSESD